MEFTDHLQTGKLFFFFGKIPTLYILLIVRVQKLTI